MPIYEYLCEKCNHEFEREQRITDDPVKTCPKCRSRKVKKLISQTSFVLKGGGWYSDLYSSSNGKKGSDDGDADSSTSSEAASASSDDGASDGDKSASKKSTPKKKSKGKSGSKKSGSKKSAA